MLKWGIQEWYNEMVLIIEYYRTEMWRDNEYYYKQELTTEEIK